ncbi:hypothetical protein MLD38_015309 [Melastoma candidum]|uniref:Uncharacterized protein n=1 Tax=Melastoma candidum TaxID=119954 RepID=A0ACB9RFK0_9MYRT|nr:hypothetical protein MLD38_015309 [Melastoma candidum]
MAAAESYLAESPSPTSTDHVRSDVLFKARESCYKARDAFYTCLDRESSTTQKPMEIGSVGLLYPSSCKAIRSEYEGCCRASWVKHFDRLYCRNKTLQRLLDDKDTRRGPMALPQPSTFKPPS